MYYSDKLILISEAATFDANGNQIKTPTTKTVYADLQNVGQSEYFAGQQTGLKAELRAVVRRSTYGGEKTVQIGTGAAAVRYSIYRTFNRDAVDVELYLTKKAGG